MGKLKTKKTLVKRIKITKTGKFFRKQIRTGHLKVKMDVSRKQRKSHMLEQTDSGNIRKFKRLLGI